LPCLLAYLLWVQRGPGYTPSPLETSELGRFVGSDTLSKGATPVTILDTIYVKNGRLPSTRREVYYVKSTSITSRRNTANALQAS